MCDWQDWQPCFVILCLWLKFFTFNRKRPTQARIRTTELTNWMCDNWQTGYLSAHQHSNPRTHPGPAPVDVSKFGQGTEQRQRASVNIKVHIFLFHSFQDECKIKKKTKKNLSWKYHSNLSRLMKLCLCDGCLDQIANSKQRVTKSWEIKLRV